MSMDHLRGRISTRNEEYVFGLLRDLGMNAQPFGQGMWTDALRDLIRGEPDPQRWAQDYMVGIRPRQTGTTRGRSVYVDAKFSGRDTGNFSVEMRALIAAGMSTMPTFYVWTTYHHGLGGTFSDPMVVSHDDIAFRIAGRDAWPCCRQCSAIYANHANPMTALPRYCERQTKSAWSSGTPYFVVGPPFAPLSAQVFDNADYGRPADPMTRCWGCGYPLVVGRWSPYCGDCRARMATRERLGLGDDWSPFRRVA